MSPAPFPDPLDPRDRHRLDDEIERLLRAQGRPLSDLGLVVFHHTDTAELYPMPRAQFLSMLEELVAKGSKHAVTYLASARENPHGCLYLEAFPDGTSRFGLALEMAGRA